MELLTKRLFNKLEDLAKKKKTISYSEMAEYLRIDLGNPDDRWNLMGKLMGGVNDITIPKGYALTSIIIHKKELGQSKPGNGYFDLLRSLKIYNGKERKDLFWAKQLKKCFDYYDK